MIRNMGSKVTDIISLISTWWVILGFPLVLFFVFGAALTSDTVEQYYDWFWLITFLGLFGTPPILAEFIKEGKQKSKWRRGLFISYYYLFVGTAVFSAMMWYVYPEQSRLEPLTVLLGFCAAWTTYIRENELDVSKTPNISTNTDDVLSPEI
ncbi:MAG: hypothetical protein AAFR81_04295 [Chloroflexota bacterium]